MRKVCWTLGCSSSARGRNVGLPSSGSAGVLSIALTLGRQRRDGREDARRHDVLSLQQSESRSRARGHADHVFAEDELDRRVHARRLDDVAPAAPKGELRVLRVILGAGLRRVARRGALGPKVPWRSAGQQKRRRTSIAHRLVQDGEVLGPVEERALEHGRRRARMRPEDNAAAWRSVSWFDRKARSGPRKSRRGSASTYGQMRCPWRALRWLRAAGSERPRDVLERPRRNGAGALVLASEGLCEASRQRMREQENRERGWTPRDRGALAEALTRVDTLR